ncbi:MAG: poly-gamma-glutamate hydrolase family protein [Actinomycetota bacterium]
MRTDGTFEEFLSHPEVTERVELAGRVGVMAFHAGLEEGTGPIAVEVAERSGASLYVAEQPEELQWHVSSHRVVAEASSRLASFLGHVETVIAVHGYGRPHLMRSILLGGQDRSVAEVVAVPLIKRLHGYEVLHRLDDIPRVLRGLHETNPVNVTSGGGVQLELPPRLRMTLPYWARHLVPQQEAQRALLVDGLVDAVERLERRRSGEPAVVVGAGG